MMDNRWINFENKNNNLLYNTFSIEISKLIDIVYPSYSANQK